MTDNEAFMEAMRRLEETTEELGKIKRALQATRDGVPFEEAFNEELYMEGYNANELKKFSILLVRHFLERKYSTDHNPDNHWDSEIEEYRDSIMDGIDWELFKKKMSKKKGYGHDTGPVLYMRSNLQNFYENGIIRYEKLRNKTIKENKPLTLPDISDILPEECPWTLEEFLDAPIDKIMELLPDMDH